MRPPLSGFSGHATGDHTRCPTLGCPVARRPQLMRLLEEGLSRAVIAHRLGVARGTLYAELRRGRREGWLPPRRGHP